MPCHRWNRQPNRKYMYQFIVYESHLVQFFDSILIECRPNRKTSTLFCGRTIAIARQNVPFPLIGNNKMQIKILFLIKFRIEPNRFTFLYIYSAHKLVCFICVVDWWDLFMHEWATKLSYLLSLLLLLFWNSFFGDFFSPFTAGIKLRHVSLPRSSKAAHAITYIPHFRLDFIYHYPAFLFFVRWLMFVYRFR